MNKARMLTLDIETAPIMANVWALWDQNVGLNQINSDWHLLSFAAKWLGEDKVIYADQRGRRNKENDLRLLKILWKLLDEADIVIGHNAKRFDVKKINARFLLAGMKPPSPYKVVDTMIIAKSQFMFTSNKLEFLTDKLNVKYKKLPHGKFPGFALWKAVMADKPGAWEEMEEYNKYDVLSTEELYLILRPWDRQHPNLATYDQEDEGYVCPVCGSSDLWKRGFHHTNTGIFQRYQCSCGAWSHDRTNASTKTKRKATLSS